MRPLAQRWMRYNGRATGAHAYGAIDVEHVAVRHCNDIPIGERRGRRRSCYDHPHIFWGRMRTVHILASLVMLMVAAIGMLAALHLIIELPIWSLSKAPEWIAAIGTVGTLAASLWFATAETRRRRKEGMQRAHIVASALAPRIALFRSELGGAADGLDFSNEFTGHRETPREEAAVFLQSQYLSATTEELLVLTALDGGYGRADARVAIQEYIESFYNRQRRHSRLGYIPPALFAEQFIRQPQAS